MYELALVSSGFIAGGLAVSAIFRWGMSYATNLIYKIKEDIPLDNIGRPIEQDGTD